MKNPQSRLVRFGPLTAILCSFPAVGCVVSHAPQHDVESDDALTQSACTEPGSPPKTFSKLYGGSSTDRFAAVQQARNGRIIMAGSTSSFGAGGYDDVWLVEADAKGRKVWDKTFGGSETDQANAVQQTSDGGYIVAGVTQSFGAGMGDGWLIKTDRKGNKIWDRTFGGTGPDEIRAVRQTRDGGYILAGYSESSGDHGGDAWLIKTDAAGNKVWEKTFGGANTSFYNQDSANAVQETSNGDYVLAGFTTVAFPSGTWSTDAWLIKTDRKGNKIWDRTFGGTGESHSDSANAVQQTRDGGYILAGRTNSYAVVEPDVWAPDDAWLIKTDADGNMLWNKASEEPATTVPMLSSRPRMVGMSLPEPLLPS
jgi:hypothetical protein